MRKRLFVVVIFIIVLMLTGCDLIPSGSGGSNNSESDTLDIRKIYDLAVDAGYVGTFDEWLLSLKGEKGDTGVGIAYITKTDSVDLIDTYTITYTDGSKSTFTITNGVQGENGKSAYELYKDAHPGYNKTEQEWLDDLMSGNLDVSEMFTVKFETGTSSKIDDQIIIKGEKISKPTDPVKEGYKFGGWYVDDEKWMFSGFVVTEDTTLTAKWIPNIVVSFDTGCDAVVSDQIVTEDGLIKEPNTPTREGYTFDGWYLGNDIWDFNTGIVKKTMTLAAKWTINEYTLSIKNYYVNKFDYNSQDDDANSFLVKVYQYGEAIDIEVPTAKGLAFLGYGEDLPKTMPASNLTYEASWQLQTQYPNLNGYTIKIAQALTALGIIDPFLPIDTRDSYGYYDKADREIKQQVWREVEQLFNCKIEVVAYPQDAPWGPSRWMYISENVKNKTSQYDFYSVPSAQITTFVNGDIIYDLTDWYNKYNFNFMSNISKMEGSRTGKLYSIIDGVDSLYNILGYNVGLWKEINRYDHSIKEPAQMFLDGEWNYTNFVFYCKKCQDALNSIYGGDAGYYVLSGWPTCYFVGMVDRNGEGVADVNKKQVHILNDDATNAVNALQELYNYGAMDTIFQVDGNVQSWNANKALFNTGDLWFVNHLARWSADLWGQGDATRYGYVPFPAPDGLEGTDKIYIGTSSDSACIVMGKGRDANYVDYGPECTAENIYYAISTYIQDSRDLYQSSENYSVENELRTTATSLFGSEASVNAFVLVNSKLETYGFYEPMSVYNNPVCSTFGSNLDYAIRRYVNGTGAATWAEAVGGLQDGLNAAIIEAFG